MRHGITLRRRCLSALKRCIQVRRPTAAIAGVTTLFAGGALAGVVVTGAPTALAQTAATGNVIQGLLDRHGDHALPYLSGFVVRVPWSTIEPTQGSFDYSSIDSAVSYAQAHQEGVLLRVEAGTSSPSWVDSLAGSFTIFDQNGQARTQPKFWTSQFDSAYRDLSAHLAARYDGSAAVAGFESSECQMYFSEPYLRDDWNPQNITNLLAAGFTTSADATCHLREMHAGLDFWTHTPTRISFTPYQSISATGKVSPDEAVTDQDMKTFRAMGGSRAVLGNNSISSTRMTVPTYAQMYALQKQLGPPIEYQTATAAKIGDWQATLQWAVAQGANAVELPSGYTSWDPTILAQFNAQLLANPTGSGQSGASISLSPSSNPSPSASPSTSPTQRAALGRVNPCADLVHRELRISPTCS